MLDTLKQEATEIIQNANIKNEGDFRNLLKDIKNSFESGMLSEDKYNQITGTVRVWWYRHKREIIMQGLEPEFKKLLEAAGRIECLKHSNINELETIHKLYGDSSTDMLALDVALEIGYMKGIRAERKRRRQKV